MKANNQYNFYRKQEIIQDRVITTEANDSTENSVNNQYEFFTKVKGDGFHISKGSGTSNIEVQPGNITEFMRLIKLDDEGRIKVKYK